MLLVWTAYVAIRQRNSRRAQRAYLEALDAGLTEPASLHPLIDVNRCLGCGSCVAACPEQEAHGVLGVVRGKAQLVRPSECIGHGACKAACPVGAISLVFGTERRGVDIPQVSPDFETNVPGIFIAGELGGMGLIRNAIEQGRSAMDSVKHRPGVGKGKRLDVLIVGAGPAGLAATLRAKQHGLRYVTVEQESLGGTVYQFPRGKIVMTAPVDLPLFGRMRFRETSKEALLCFWQDVEKRSGIRINYHERVESIRPVSEGFEVQTTRQRYTTNAILLAIGRRGTPRKLGVSGEDLPKVVYRLIDPEQYRGQRVLVVGGGDSALEAAASIAEQPDTQVSIAYRGDAFSRAKPKNRARVDAAASKGRLHVLLESVVERIEVDNVELDQAGTRKTLANDAVIVCAGGILPTKFLKDVGVDVQTKYGTA